MVVVPVVAPPTVPACAPAEVPGVAVAPAPTPAVAPLVPAAPPAPPAAAPPPAPPACAIAIPTEKSDAVAIVRILFFIEVLPLLPRTTPAAVKELDALACGGTLEIESRPPTLLGDCRD